jgi:hypothetical protein
VTSYSVENYLCVSLIVYKNFLLIVLVSNLSINSLEFILNLFKSDWASISILSNQLCRIESDTTKTKIDANNMKVEHKENKIKLCKAYL